MSDASGFELCTVVHLIRPWGPPAGNLEQLREGIASAPGEAIFFHAVQYRLRHPAAAELPRDDFSAWIGGVMQDAETAERMSFEVQGAAATPASLRGALLGVLDALPARRRAERRAPEGCAFQPLCAYSLSVPLGTIVRDGGQLVDALMSADAGVWFFHLVEQPFLHEGRAPLLDWLSETRHEKLGRWLREAAGAGLPIDGARTRLQRRWRRSRIGPRVADAMQAPEDGRREAARQAVARLVRRRAGPGPPA